MGGLLLDSDDGSCNPISDFNRVDVIWRDERWESLTDTSEDLVISNVNLDYTGCDDLADVERGGSRDRRFVAVHQVSLKRTQPTDGHTSARRVQHNHGCLQHSSERGSG